MSSNQKGPLTGVKVLDLTQVLAGPFATMLMADLGADVVKIEPPSGDMSRESDPRLTDDEAYGGYFHSINRNKRSLAIDLKSDEGKQTFRSLVKKADVVVENYRTGVMDRLGLPYEDLREINPGLIYASIRGFGDPRTGESHYADRPAYGFIAQAFGGIMSITGTEEEGPTKVGPGVGDIFPGVLSVVGILSALQHRNRTGEGQYVDVGMVDGILSLCERMVHQYSFEREVPGPQGNSHPLIFPFDRFDTVDGHIVITAYAPHQWVSLCEHMDRPNLAAEYKAPGTRRENAEKLYPEVNEWTRQHTKEELFDILEDDVPCAPVNDVEDIFEEQHFEERDMLQEVEHADTGQTVTLVGTPIKFSEFEGGIKTRAPFLGEHSRSVLSEYGLDERTVDELIASETVLDKSPPESATEK